uniref:Uncharacterized protein n=1 Tax=Rhizophora mucronata TaxID=61149 RepID=A0A2P2PA78_RHIMU
MSLCSMENGSVIYFIKRVKFISILKDRLCRR